MQEHHPRLAGQPQRAEKTFGYIIEKDSSFDGRKDSYLKNLYVYSRKDMTVTLHGDAEWDAVVDRMMSLSEQGYDVRIINESASSQPPATKDVQTITTTDCNEAKAWA